MKKNPSSKSGIFNPRILLALTLCSIGACLALLALADLPSSTSVHSPSQGRFARLAPSGGSRPSGKVASLGTRAPGVFGPVVSTSVANATSAALRDLRLAAPQTARVEHELGPVHASHPLPFGFLDPVRQNSFAALAAPSPLITFEGQSADDSGCGCIPPDTNGAVGPTQYVQMVNSSLSVYSKTGTRLSGPTRINALWNNLPGTCKDNNNGDPVVVYDQLADRWLVSQFAFPFDADNNPIAPWDECIAISKTPDATGEYYVYDFFLSDTEFQDYPHFGMWPDAYYMSTHQFLAPDFGYDGAGVWAFERDKMLVGDPSAQLIYFNLGPVNPAFGGHLPANLDGYTLPPAGSPNYFVEVDDSADIGPVDAMRIWKFHVDWTTPANSTFGLSGQPNFVVPVADFSRPPCVLGLDLGNCVPQPLSDTQLDPIGDRLMYRLAYRNFGDHEALVLNHTVVADATTIQHGPRWYEVRNPGGSGGPPTIFQQGTLAPTGPTDLLHRWMSSIAMDHSGNIAIGYSTSSNTNFPSIAYAGRLAADPPPLGQLSQGETQMFAGGGSEQPFLFIGAGGLGRWGDYSDMTVDPSDDCTFWYTQEYFPTPVDPFTVWHTRIGSFKFPQCVPSTPPPGTPVMHPSGSSLVTETCFAPNNVIDPGETVSVELCVTNLGSANTANLVGTLATTGGVTNPSAPQTYGAVPAIGPAVCKTFTFTAANQACGSQITASLQLQDGALNLGTVNYNFTLGTAIADFSENFDGVTAPALPAGWTATNIVPPAGEPMWVTTTSDPDSPPNAAFASEPATPSDKNLDSPEFDVPAAGATLSFRHKFNFDPGFDGAVLEIKIGTGPGPFTDWLTAGGTFSANGYNGTIDGTYGNPIVPPDTERAAWTNSSNGYITTTAIFPAGAAGQTVQLRFRMGSDSLVAGAGWEVDEIAVNKSFTCCSAGPASAVSRKVHNLATFDIPLPLTGQRGVECRSPGQTGTTGVDYKVVFTFPNNIATNGCGTTSTVGGSVVSGPSANQCTVNLTGIPNGQYTTVNLNGVTDVAGNSGPVSTAMGLLVGDVNGDVVNATGLVDSGDVFLVRQQTGQTTTSSNFRKDINASGLIDSGDVFLTRQRTGSQLPTPP